MRGLIVSLTMAPIFAGASIPQNTQRPVIEKVLAQKSEKKFSDLKKMGPRVYADLKRIAFNEDRALGIRWQAFMAMVKIGEKEALPEVDLALRSQDWFMRDAAIRILPILDEDRAYKAAMRALDDSALVVRSTAVKTLKVLKRPESADKLWNELYSKENFMRNQSLWIRKYIVEALADLAPPNSEEKFIKVLDDDDSLLFEPAIRGLERLTGQKMGDPSVPAVYKRYYWKKWYQDRKKS
ncbi:MAG: HEAT repeat domain-containing protein [Oligoflexia bacterium]|nr:HEAT repeat domain-containing protein [Oligoflexia bacterium]